MMPTPGGVACLGIDLDRLRNEVTAFLDTDLAALATDKPRWRVAPALRKKTRR